MRYRLAVLTHGDATTLGHTLFSFDAKVRPAPQETVLVIDGPTPAGMAEVADEEERFSLIQSLDPQEGFCGATARLWDLAGRVETEFVFWLEADFIFEREVDLTEMAEVLENPNLAQIALLRGPVNNDERQHGGVVHHHRARGATFTEHETWLEHTSYFTTNPSLMTIGFMRENPWPSYPAQCEGRFGIDLHARGYRFGIFGDGEPWVEHIGVRSGFGY